MYRLVGGGLPHADKKQILGMESSEVLTFMKDGGWCWYQDPRALIADGKLIVGGVSGQNGDVKVAVYDLERKQDLGTVILHPEFQADDHDAPVFYKRGDGRILAMWAKHGDEKIHHYAISDAQDFTKWGSRMEYHHTYGDDRGVTYMNLFRVGPTGTVYNFFRDGEHFNPCFITSEDDGSTWGGFQHLIANEVGGRQRPYTRYARLRDDAIAISFTDGHPRQYGNSLYYVEFKNGAFYRADGSIIRELKSGPLRPSEADKVFKGSETQVKPKGNESVPFGAWTCAMATDANGHPLLGYSLYLNDNDHRYRMASWNGERWIDREIAFAGTCLYTQESSYTGLLAFDPEQSGRVFISTDVDPTTGKSLGGKHELYTAEIGLDDDINTTHWQAVTGGSVHRNIRPTVVTGGDYKVLLWLNGDWNTYTDYATDICGIVMKR